MASSSKLNAQFKVPRILPFLAKRGREELRAEASTSTQDPTPLSKRSRVTELDTNVSAFDSLDGLEEDVDEFVPLNASQLNKHSAFATPSAQTSDKDAKTDLKTRIQRINLVEQKKRALEARQRSQQASVPSSSTAASDKGKHATYYNCMYRSPQTRKHKSWEYDGYIKVLESGLCKLYDLESKRLLAEETVFKRKTFEPDAEFSIGSREVKISGKMDNKETASMQSAHTSKTKTSGEQTSALRTGFRAPSIKKEPTKPPDRASDKEDKTDSKSERISSSSFYGSGLSKSRQIGLSSLSQRASHTPANEPVDESDLTIMRRPDAAHQKKHNKSGAEVADVRINPSLAARLRPHQIEGIRFLYDAVMDIRHLPDYESSGAILADGMGVGKSVQVIGLIEMMLRQSCYATPSGRTIERALIVCPLTLVKNWRDEFIKWTGRSLKVECVSGSTNLKAMINGRYEVLIITYDSLRKHVKEISVQRFGLLVCDEAQRIKSQTSKTTQAFEKLYIDRRILLTGTPIQNNLSEFYTMIHFIAPNLLADQTTFKKTFEDPIMRGRRPNCPQKIRDKAEASSALLRKITEPLMLRREESTVKDHLPIKYEQIIFCSPSKLQMDVYNAIADGHGAKAILRSSLSSHRVPLEGIMILRKLCNSPDLLAKDVQRKGNAGEHSKAMLSDAAEVLANSDGKNLLQSGKLTLLIKMLRRIHKTTDDKVVIVSNFTATLDIVQDFCKSFKFSMLRLDGATKHSERMSIVNRFNRTSSKDSFVLLLSSKAGGTGLNLVGANRLVLLDNDWNPASDAQAMARVHRDGQKKQCYIYRLLLSGTMDEKIFQRQLSKTALSDALMSKEQDVSKIGEDFSDEDLRDIFRFHHDTTCLTHDMLCCSCQGQGGTPDVDTDGDEEGNDDSEQEDGDDAQYSFRPASQVMKDGPDATKRKNRRKLAALLSWSHHSFAEPGQSRFTEDNIIEQIIKSQRKGAEGSRAAGKDDGTDEGDALEPSEAGRFNLADTTSGQILFVFANKSAKMVEQVDEEGDSPKIEQLMDETA